MSARPPEVLALEALHGGELGPTPIAAAGAGGGARVLGARYNGGLELHDGTGHLPRDAQGFYLSRATGEPLVVDEGWSAGDPVGPAKLRNLLSAVVEGTPDNGGRRTGLHFAGTDRITITLGANPHSFLARVETGATLSGIDAALGAAASGSGNRWTVLLSGGTVQCRAYDAADVEQARAQTTALAANTVYWIAGTFDGTTLTAHKWSADGTHLQSPSDSPPTPIVPAGGLYFIGNNSNSTIPLNMAKLLDTFGWDGEALTQAQFQTVIDAVNAGGTVDTTAADAALASDGIVCGAYDEASPSTLYTLSATGSAVTAEAL